MESHFLHQQTRISLHIKISEILVGEYLFCRLKQFGVQTVFGVPGGESSTIQTWVLLNLWLIKRRLSNMKSPSNRCCTLVAQSSSSPFSTGFLEQGLSWVATPNELVSAYAANDYAREKGFGTLVTTFGPGELSALCGIGGAFCENVPVLHIVGYRTRPVQAGGKIIDFTLGDFRYG